MASISDDIRLMQNTLGVGTNEDQKVFHILSEKIRYNAELTLLKSIINQNEDIPKALEIINQKIDELSAEIEKLEDTLYSDAKVINELSEKKQFLKVLLEQRDILLSNNYVGYVWNIKKSASMQELVDRCSIELKNRYSKVANLFGQDLVVEEFIGDSVVPHFKVNKDIVFFIFSLVTNNKIMNNFRVLNAIDQKLKMSESEIKKIEGFITTLTLLLDSNTLSKYFEYVQEYQSSKKEIQEIKTLRKKLKIDIKELESRLFTSLTNSRKLKTMHHRLEHLKDKQVYYTENMQSSEDIIKSFIEKLEDEGLKRILTIHFDLIKTDKINDEQFSFPKMKNNLATSLSLEDDFYELIASFLDTLNKEDIERVLDLLNGELNLMQDDYAMSLKEAQKYKKFLNSKIVSLAQMNFASCMGILDVFDRKYENGLSPLMIITVLVVSIKVNELSMKDLDELINKEDMESLRLYFRNIIDTKAKHDLDITTSLIESDGKESFDSRLSLI